MAPSMSNTPLIGRDHVARAETVPPTVFPTAPSIRIPSFELPRSAVPDLSVPIRLPSIRFPVDVGPSISIPDQVARDHLRHPAVGFDRVPGSVFDLNAVLGVAQIASPVESVPIRLSLTMTAVAAAPEIKTPIRLAEITLPGPISCPASSSPRRPGRCPAPPCRRKSGR